MGLVIANVLSAIWMRPVMGLTFELMDVLLTPLAWLVK
jgi:hypothetical protein